MGKMTRDRERERKSERKRGFKFVGKKRGGDGERKSKILNRKFEAWPGKKRFPLQWFKICEVRGR